MGSIDDLHIVVNVEAVAVSVEGHRVLAVLLAHYRLRLDALHLNRHNRHKFTRVQMIK